MNKPLMLLLALLSTFMVQAQNAELPVSIHTTTEALSINEAAYDFGQIPQGKPVYHNFEVKNNTSAPLKLDNVTATCGCTTPEWSRNPIAPGATAVIKVGFNAASQGPFEKFISIAYNGNQLKQVKIKGNVWQAPEGAAPANEAVNFLKKQIQ